MMLTISPIELTLSHLKMNPLKTMDKTIAVVEAM